MGLMANEEVIAFIQPRTGSDISGDAIETHLRARLAPYKIPGRIVFLDTLPLGGTGKILKRRLIEELRQA